MRIYSTVQLCSITSLWHSGQHLCRAIGRLQVRISQGFWLLSKRRSLWSWLLWKKNFLSWTAMHIDFVMCKKKQETNYRFKTLNSKPSNVTGFRDRSTQCCKEHTPFILSAQTNFLFLSLLNAASSKSTPKTKWDDVTVTYGEDDRMTAALAFLPSTNGVKDFELYRL